MPKFIIKTEEKINRIFSLPEFLLFVDAEGELKREGRLDVWLRFYIC
jgi:hypothetical protein